MRAAIALWLLVGCADMRDHDGRVPGQALGTFHVAATLQASTCGSGALGSPDSWQFDVKLSRDGSRLFWLNGGAPVEGRIETDGMTFGFETAIQVELARDAGQNGAGCVVDRLDRAAGKLESRGSEVSAFAGTLRSAYSAQGDCSALVGVNGGFSVLPCSLSYDIVGELTEGPQR